MLSKPHMPVILIREHCKIINLGISMHTDFIVDHLLLVVAVVVVHGKRQKKIKRMNNKRRKKNKNRKTMSGTQLNSILYFTCLKTMLFTILPFFISMQCEIA